MDPRPEIRPGRRRRRNPGRDGLPDLLLGVVHLQERDKPQPLGLRETPLRGRLLNRIVRRPGVLCPGPDPRTARDHLLRLEHIGPQDNRPGHPRNRHRQHRVLLPQNHPIHKETVTNFNQKRQIYRSFSTHV